jgi:hypothetical protein
LLQLVKVNNHDANFLLSIQSAAGCLRHKAIILS